MGGGDGVFDSSGYVDTSSSGKNLPTDDDVFNDAFKSVHKNFGSDDISMLFMTIDGVIH